MVDISYFRHYHNERDSEGVKKLIARFGATGYGVYWYVLERLYFSFNREFELGEGFYKRASIELHTSRGTVRRVVDMMVATGLVSKMGNIVSSERVEHEAVEMLEAKKRRREAAKKAGKASAIARQKIAE